MYLCYRGIKYRLEETEGATLGKQDTRRRQIKQTAQHKTKQKILHLDFGTVSTVWYSSFIILFIVQSLQRVGRWESEAVNRRTDN